MQGKNYLGTIMPNLIGQSRPVTSREYHNGRVTPLKSCNLSITVLNVNSEEVLLSLPSSHSMTQIR